MSKLFDSDSDGDAEGPDVKLGVNKSFASTYTKARKGEELQKLQDRYGKTATLPSSSDSSGSSEDEEAGEWTGEHERQFLQALSDIKARRIEGKQYFAAANKRTVVAAKAESNGQVEEPMYLKDYERKLVTERKGKLSEDESSDGDEADPTPVARQKQLKDSFKSAVADAFNDDDGEEDVLKARTKTVKEEESEEKDYRDWLKGRSDGRDKEFEDLKALKDYWQDPKLAEGERFLRDYVLNDGHRESNEANRIPTYDEVIADDQVEEEEKKMDEFEHKFNFRFEEPDQEFIKQYPRTVGESVRTKDERRKNQRETYKDRKAKEKERIRTDLLELKSLKRSAIEEKLMKLRKVTGDESLPMTVDELDADFDPAEYDRKMKAMFDDKYYGKDGDASDNDDDEKPEFSDLSDREYDDDEDDVDEVDDDWDNLDVVAVKQKADEPSTSKSASTTKKKSGKKHKLMEAVEHDKPVFDPDSRSFEEYVKEYYALDCEDVVGDVRCKFRYRNVPANDFGLTVDEILTADDKELNAWASLKKTSQYREERDEAHDQKAYQRKAADEDKKKRVLASVYKSKKGEVKQEDDDTAVETIETASTKKGRRKRKRNAGNTNDTGTVEDGVEETKPAPDAPSATETKTTPSAKTNGSSAKKSKSSKRKSRTTDRPPVAAPRGTAVDALPDERLAAFGINPKKFKNKQKYGPKKTE